MSVGLLMERLGIRVAIFPSAVACGDSTRAGIRQLADGCRRRLRQYLSRKKSRARLASPQPRPTSPVNGAGGMTGCRENAAVSKIVPDHQDFFGTRLSDG